MNRNIIYISIPDLPAAVEQLRDSSLRERPVAVCSRHSPKAPVLSVSARARAENIFPGMPISKALQRCPGLSVVHPDTGLYTSTAQKLHTMLGSYSPRIEPGSQDGFYLDMTGTSRLFGASGSTAYRIRGDIVSATGLRPAIGIGSNKLVSRVAADSIACRADMYAVPPGSEASFMAPFRCSILPSVKNPSDRKLLYQLNIRYVHQVAAMPVSRLAAVFGSRAHLIYHQAMGIDNRPVQPPRSKPFVFAEQAIEPDTNDDSILVPMLLHLLSYTCSVLRKKQMLAKAAWFHARYCDSIDTYRNMRLPVPSANELLLKSPVTDLFCRAVVRRQRISYISLTLTDLAGMSRQADLFEHDIPSRQDAVVQAVDAVTEKFGTKITWGSTLAAFKQQGRPLGAPRSSAVTQRRQ